MLPSVNVQQGVDNGAIYPALTHPSGWTWSSEHNVSFACLLGVGHLQEVMPCILGASLGALAPVLAGGTGCGMAAGSGCRCANNSCAPYINSKSHAEAHGTCHCSFSARTLGTARLHCTYWMALSSRPFCLPPQGRTALVSTKPPGPLQVCRASLRVVR